MLLAFAVALSFAVVATRFGTGLFSRIALRIGLVDKPDSTRKFQRRATPVGAGLVVFGVSLAATALAAATSPALRNAVGEPFWLLAATGSFLVAVGLRDDRKSLNAVRKLALQFAVAAVAVWPIRDRSVVEIFAVAVDLKFLFYPLAVVWLVALTNALNFLDGADGVVAVVGVCLFSTIGVIGVLNGRFDAAVPAFAFAASLVGFFDRNRPPARVYLGDAGSLSLGFAIGVLSGLACETERSTFRIVPAVALVVVPLADVAFAVVRRLNADRSVFSPDLEHVHHRLRRRLGGDYRLLVALAAIQLPFCAASVAGVRLDDDLTAVGIAASAFVVLVATGVFGRDECKSTLNRLRRRLQKPFFR